MCCGLGTVWDVVTGERQSGHGNKQRCGMCLCVCVFVMSVFFSSLLLNSLLVYVVYCLFVKTVIIGEQFKL